jgi:DNA repair exonuclease SbcCD ATPase subunit
MSEQAELLRWLNARESSAMVQKETASKDGTLRFVCEGREEAYREVRERLEASRSSLPDEGQLAKAERHCEEAIEDVVRAEKLIERRIRTEREDGTPFGAKFCEEVLAELRATDTPSHSKDTGTPTEPCERCGGSGLVNGGIVKGDLCPRCFGKGRIPAPDCVSPGTPKEALAEKLNGRIAALNAERDRLDQAGDLSSPFNRLLQDECRFLGALRFRAEHPPATQHKGVSADQLQAVEDQRDGWERRYQRMRDEKVELVGKLNLATDALTSARATKGVKDWLRGAEAAKTLAFSLHLTPAHAIVRGSLAALADRFPEETDPNGGTDG